MDEGAYAEAASAYQDLLNFDSARRRSRATVWAPLSASWVATGRPSRIPSRDRDPIRLRRGAFQSRNRSAMAGAGSESEQPLRRALKLKPDVSRCPDQPRHDAACCSGRLREARELLREGAEGSPRECARPGRHGAGRRRSKDASPRPRPVPARPRDRARMRRMPWAALAWLRSMTPADGAWVKRAEETSPAADSARSTRPNTALCDRQVLRRRRGLSAGRFATYQRANELHKLRADALRPGGRTRVRGRSDARLHSRGVSARRAADALRLRATGVRGRACRARAPRWSSRSSPRTRPRRGAGELDFWTDAVRKHEAAVAAASCPRPPRAGAWRRITCRCSSALRRRAARGRQGAGQFRLSWVSFIRCFPRHA